MLGLLAVVLLLVMTAAAVTIYALRRGNNVSSHLLIEWRRLSWSVNSSNQSRGAEPGRIPLPPPGDSAHVTAITADPPLPGSPAPAAGALASASSDPIDGPTVGAA